MESIWRLVSQVIQYQSLLASLPPAAEQQGAVAEFSLPIIDHISRTSKMITLKSIQSVGDDGEQTITIMLPNEVL